MTNFLIEKGCKWPGDLYKDTKHLVDVELNQIPHSRLQSRISLFYICQRIMLTSFEFLVNYFQIGMGEGGILNFLSFFFLPSFLNCNGFGSASDSNYVQECTCLLRMDILIVDLKIKSGNTYFFSLAFRLYVLIIIKDILKASWL